jgi:hypothetical protein
MHWIDPQSLSPIEGTVAQFVMNRDGELDGLLLTRGNGVPQLVHFPPHMAGNVEAAIKVGDHLIVRGVRPRGADVIAAVSLSTADGQQIIDDGPDAPRTTCKPLSGDALSHHKGVSGIVRLSLIGPTGELRGAILEDGTVIRIGKKEAVAFTDLLRPGAAIAARGTAIATALGTMLDAHEIGVDKHSLQPVKGYKPAKPKKEKKPKHNERVEA